MSKVLIIGCGGVASVAIHKCCQVPEGFTDICIASRTKSKCDKLAAELAPKTTTRITTAQVDADHVDEVIALIKSYQPDLVMNIALPYQDLTIMDACLACGVNYMDTANYEPENTDDPAWRAIYEKRCKEAGFSAYFDYSWQWAYAKKFEEAGLLAALLVDGTPRGVVGVFRLVVGSVHIVYAAGQAGVHDGQILIRQGDIHNEVRLVAVDEVAQLLDVVGIDLRGGDFGPGGGGQLGGQRVALGFGAAGDAQLGKDIADLAALGDGDACHAAAADNKNFAHDGTPLYFFYCMMCMDVL